MKLKISLNKELKWKLDGIQITLNRIRKQMKSNLV